MLRRHLSILSTGEKKAEELFNAIVSLKVGEALVFASSALLALPAEVGRGVTAIKKMNSDRKSVV